MLILTEGPLREVAALAARIAPAGAPFLDARGLSLSPAAVRSVLDRADDSMRSWLMTVPAGIPIGEFALRVRRYGERVVQATRLNAGDLGTLLADATPVADATPPLPSLETPRLRLAFPTRSQSDGYYADIVGTDMFSTILWEGPASTEDLPTYWHDCTQRTLDGPHEPLSLAVIERSTERYIGGAALRPIGGDPEQIDIGYAFAPHAHGKGYATEAVGALVDEAFARRGAQRIIATVFTGNDASRRVVEKLGFTCEGVLRDAVRKRGVMLDEWMMAMTRSDWEARARRRTGRAT
ncbi:MAG: GNAT family N-acetyltransferase [Deltaproteobacteria bacterium]|nr:GNAT family N-acetyltransferase [Deltaproteobacteria bacterium]